MINVSIKMLIFTENSWILIYAAGTWRRSNVDATLWRRIDVDTTLMAPAASTLVWRWYDVGVTPCACSIVTYFFTVSISACYPNDTIIVDNPGNHIWYRADNNETACNITLNANDQFIITGCQKVDNYWIRWYFFQKGAIHLIRGLGHMCHNCLELPRRVICTGQIFENVILYLVIE